MNIGLGLAGDEESGHGLPIIECTCKEVGPLPRGPLASVPETGRTSFWKRSPGSGKCFFFCLCKEEFLSVGPLSCRCIPPL